MYARADDGKVRKRKCKEKTMGERGLGKVREITKVGVRYCVLSL